MIIFRSALSCCSGGRREDPGGFGGGARMSSDGSEGPAAATEWRQRCCWGPGDKPAFPDLPRLLRRPDVKSGVVPVEPVKADGLRWTLSPEPEVRSVVRCCCASFLRVPGFSQRGKSRNRKSDVLFSVFLHWQTRENLSYSASAPVQLPRNRLVHRLAAVPPAFPCFLFHFPARRCRRLHQVKECLINDDKLRQEGGSRRNYPR